MKHGIKYKHIVRPVTYPRLEFRSGELEVIAPQNADISSLLERHNKWIYEKLGFINKNNKSKTKDVVERTEDELKKCIERYLRKAEAILHIQHSYYRFRSMKTKWATSSQKGIITYNKIVRYLPNNLIWYITFHEMAHLLVTGHNKKFWHVINRQIKRAASKEQELYSYWFTVHRNMEKTQNLENSRTLARQTD